MPALYLHNVKPLTTLTPDCSGISVGETNEIPGFLRTLLSVIILSEKCECIIRLFLYQLITSWNIPQVKMWFNLCLWFSCTQNLESLNLFWRSITSISNVQTVKFVCTGQLCNIWMLANCNNWIWWFIQGQYPCTNTGKWHPRLASKSWDCFYEYCMTMMHFLFAIRDCHRSL